MSYPTNYNYIRSFESLITSNNQYNAYIQNLIGRVNALPDCGDLNDLETEAYSVIQSILTQVEGQIPVLKILTTIPTDLGSAINWITTYINNNVLKPYENALAMEATLLASINQLMTAVNSKYVNMKCSYQPLQGLVNNIKVTADQLSGSILVGGF